MKGFSSGFGTFPHADGAHEQYLLLHGALPGHEEQHGMSGVVDHSDHVSEEPVSTLHEDGFVCAFLDCGKRYAAKSSLQRHERSHSNARYDCWVPTCKFRGRLGNTRLDKLINHLRKGHPEVETWQCPLQDCDVELPSLFILTIHVTLHFHTHSKDKEYLVARSVSRTLSLIGARCPITGCDKRMSPKHLESHTSVERRQAAGVLQQIGFDWETISLICPICSHTFSSLGEGWNTTHLHAATEHVAEKHVVADWERLKTVTLRYHRFDLAFLSENGRCKVCGTNIQDLQWNEKWEHGRQCIRTLYNDSSTIYPFRESLLRIDSDFIKHPVFDDIRPRN